jgi:arabinogalactan oligomer/maltooligosaccharide transport system substrate-binding protein
VLAEGVGTPVADNVTGATTPEPTPTPALAGRITVWHSWAEADGDALAQILAAFQQTHPQVTVDTLFVSYTDLMQSYADAVRAGSGPDLLLGSSWWLGDIVGAGVVQPLDDLVTPEELATYWPAAVDNLRWDGALYALPTHVELVSLFYNRALVTPEELPTTVEALTALAGQGGRQGSGLYASLYHLAWGFAGYGAALFDEGGRIRLDQSSGAADFLAWLAALGQTPGTFVDEDYGMIRERFKKQEFAFFVDGPWAIGELRVALGADLGVTLLPAGPLGPGQPWLSADGVFLNPQISAEQQTLALAFARAITGAEAGGILARVAGRLPAHSAATIGDDALLQGFLEQAASAQPLPNRPEMETVWGYGGDMLLKVLKAGADPQQVVAETATLINEANGK